MKAKKRLNLSIPLWWPSSPGWRRLARALTPHPGTLIVTLLVVAAIVWAQSVGALPLRAPAAASTSTGTIAYQGRLADADGNPLTDTYNMIFRLYDMLTGGVFLWEEQWTGPNGVKVSDGLFNVMLGSLTPIPQSVITGHDSLFLGITVGTDDEMTPRVQLGSVPFAVQALTVPDGSITTTKIADEAVTQAKLDPSIELEPPDGSVTTGKIADGAVTQAKAPTLLKVDSWLPNDGEYWRIAAGTAIISVPAGSGHYTVSYVEHSPAFTVPPALFCSIGAVPVGSSEVICELYSNPLYPESQAVIVLRTVDRSYGLAQGEYEVHWLAIGY